MDSITITLADKQFTVQPLTVGQLEEIHIGMLGDKTETMKDGGRAWWKQTRELFVAALSEDHPDMTLEAICKMRIGSFQTVKAARDEILIFAGFMDKPKEGAPTGEAPAAAA